MSSEPVPHVRLPTRRNVFSLFPPGFPQSRPELITQHGTDGMKGEKAIDSGLASHTRWQYTISRNKSYETDLPACEATKHLIQMPQPQTTHTYKYPFHYTTHHSRFAGGGFLLVEIHLENGVRKVKIDEKS